MPCESYCGEEHIEEEFKTKKGSLMKCNLCGYTICSYCGDKKWRIHNEMVEEEEEEE